MDHTCRHDVHAQTVDTNNRWLLAIFHNEGVFADRFVTATVLCNPLDLVGAVRKLWNYALEYIVVQVSWLRQVVPTYACRAGIAVGRPVDVETILLVSRYRTVVERCATEVRNRVGCWWVGAGNLCFHDTVSIHVEEQQVADAYISTAAAVGYRYTQISWSLTEVVAADGVIPVCGIVPEQWIVGGYIADRNRAGWAAGELRCFTVDNLDDLLVFVTVSIGIPKDRVVGSLWVGWIDLNHRWVPGRRSVSSRNDWAWEVRWVVADRVRIRIRYIDTRQVAVVGTPVDDGPGTLDFVASIRYYGEDFILVGYTQQFAIFAKEDRLTVVATSVALRYDNVVREFYVVILLVIHHNALGALAGEAMAIECTERAYDGTFVAKGVKLALICLPQIPVPYNRWSDLPDK